MDDSVDPTGGDQTLQALRADLDAGEWRRAVSYMSEVPPGPRRSFYLDRCSDAGPLPLWLDDYVAERDVEAFPHLLRGAYSIRWAWHARGTGGSETVTSDGFGTFWERLRAAERDLVRASQLAPLDPDPIAFLMISGRGLEVGSEELQRRFDALVARDPHHYLGLSQLGRGLQAKWGGSHELMFSFARDAAAAAPDGSPVLCIAAEAHVERQYTHIWAGETEAADAYFENESVREEIRGLERRFAAAADPSDPWCSVAHCLFGYCAAQMDDAATTMKHFYRLERPLSMPFAYSRSPKGHFDRLKAWAAAAAPAAPAAPTTQPR